MKFICILSFLFVGFKAQSQAFSFDDTVTVLIKTTNESPAHWYLEIFNNVSVDTTLRWKAVYGSTLPQEWDFNFDDQYQNYFPVLDGDSADFVLLANPLFPQKLIIGGHLNNTPGNGSIYFEIYDPNDLSTLVTIEYRFIVSQGSASISDLDSDENWFTQSGRSFTFPEAILGNEIVLYNLAGSRVYSINIESDALLLPSNLEPGVYFLTMKSENTYYSARVVLN
jgi:hypothetical protein